MRSTVAHDLTARLADLLRRERAAMADFLLALADFDRQKLWLELGYPSLFVFLHRELGLSKGAAHYRKTAAELVQRFPELVPPLRDGRLCITSIIELARVATAENLGEVLPRFFHCSRREAKEVAVEIRPAQVVPRRDVVTASTPPAVQPVEPAPTPSLGVMPPPAPEPRRSSAEPLTADLRRLHVTVSRRFLEKLEQARSALSHSHPGAGAEEILEAGLDLIVAADARRKGAAERPLENPRPSKADCIPASVKREVWARDRGRCQWPIAGRAGGICGSTLRVELDHVEPRARGGPSTAEGMRLLCRVHNDLAARLAFGDRWMDQYTQRGGVTGGGGTGGGRTGDGPERRTPGGPAG
jgi:hypothetical protein